MIDQSEMLAKMRDILGDKFVELVPKSYEVREEFDSGITKMKCQVQNSTSADAIEVNSEASGMVDAFFKGMKAHFADDFPSLSSIQISGFKVTGVMSTRTVKHGADAEALVELTVLSSEGHEFEFSSRSRSVARASIDATLQAVGYFVNSEKAFREIYRILSHYRSEGRSDLVQKYQMLLAEMVKNTSYSAVMEEIKAKELGR